MIYSFSWTLVRQGQNVCLQGKLAHIEIKWCAGHAATEAETILKETSFMPSLLDISPPQKSCIQKASDISAICSDSSVTGIVEKYDGITFIGLRHILLGSIWPVVFSLVFHMYILIPLIKASVLCEAIICSCGTLFSSCYRLDNGVAGEESN